MLLLRAVGLWLPCKLAVGPFSQPPNNPTTNHPTTTHRTTNHQPPNNPITQLSTKPPPTQLYMVPSFS